MVQEKKPKGRRQFRGTRFTGVLASSIVQGRRDHPQVLFVIQAAGGVYRQAGASTPIFLSSAN
jgi:hypothetical protein